MRRCRRFGSEQEEEVKTDKKRNFSQRSLVCLPPFETVHRYRCAPLAFLFLREPIHMYAWHFERSKERASTCVWKVCSRSPSPKFESADLCKILYTHRRPSFPSLPPRCHILVMWHQPWFLTADQNCLCHAPLQACRSSFGVLPLSWPNRGHRAYIST